jgi:hypothetical protein
VKTHTSTPRVLTLSLACLVAALAQASFGQTEATTTPVGFMTVSVPAGTASPSNSTISVPLYNTPDFTNAVATLDGTTLITPALPAAPYYEGKFTMTGANWTPSEFAGGANPRLVRVKGSVTPAHVGQTFLVSANTANQLSIILPSGVTDVSNVLSVGDSCEIVPANTLAKLFGPNLAGATNAFVGYPAVSAANWFQTGVNSGVADNVLVWNGTTWDTYYNNNTNWKKAGSLLNQNNVIIYSDDGLFVIRRAATALSVTLAGTVPSTIEQTPLAGAGSTFLPNRFPVDTTLAQTGIRSTAGWITASSAGSADKVFVWEGTTWGTYYHNGTTWRKAGSLANWDTKSIPAGTAVFITKISGGSTLTQNLPYTP